MIVGRERELEILRAALARAAGAKGQIVLLSGEAGIGKTALVSEIAAEARASALDVATGRCYADAGQHAFGPWRQAFAEAQVWSAGRDLAAELGATDSRARAFEDVLAVLTERAARSPVLVIVEDLHWADRDSLLLLLHLARFGLQQAVLLVCTVRAPDLHAARNATLDEVLAELTREAGAQHIVLHAFGEGDVAAYASTLAGGAVPQGIARALHAETGGNALYVRELVRHLLEEGKLRVREGRLATDFATPELGLPPSIRHLVRHRVARLSERSATLLRFAAAAAQPVEFAVLARASGAEPETMLDALDEALDAGILRATGGRYELSHALVRRAIDEEQSPERRARLHRRLAEVLETTPNADPSTIAAHYHASRDLPGCQAGIAYAEAAAEAARGVGAHERAAELLALALDLCDPAEPRRIAALTTSMAVARAHAFDVEGALQAIGRGAEVLSHAEVAAELPEHLVRVARALEQGGAPRPAWAPLVARGLSQLAGRRDLAWARLALLARSPTPVLEGSAWVSIFGGHDEDAVRILREQGSDDDFAATVDPHDSRSRDQTEELAMRARTWKEPAATIRVLDACARDLFFQHADFRGAAQAMEELLSLAERVGSMTGKVAALVVLGCCHAVSGDLNRARAELALARSASSRIGALHRMNVVGPLAAESVITYMGGTDWRAVVQRLVDFVSSPRAASTPFGLVALNLGLLGAAMSGDRVLADRLLLQQMRALEKIPMAVNEWGASRDSGAAALWHLGEREHAPVYLALAERSLKSRACACFGSVEHTMARMTALLGDSERARPWFADARNGFDRTGRLAMLAICDHDEALALVRNGRAREARLLLENAKKQFADLGMAPWLASAEKLEASIETPVKQLPDGLTEREAEVLRLVATGLANKEIAARLFISVPTVERHIANIYVKIGGHGRAAATAYAMRKGLLA
jgi:DNA-binding CsgD family transcriptional regulator